MRDHEELNQADARGWRPDNSTKKYSYFWETISVYGIPYFSSVSHIVANALRKCETNLNIQDNTTLKALRERFILLTGPCWPTYHSVQFSSVQSLSRVRLFATPWIAARQASLSITNSRSLLKLMSIELVMSSSHLILCHPLLLLPSIFPSIRVFSNESTHRMRWPKYWSFSFSISPSNEHPGLISFRMD